MKNPCLFCFKMTFRNTLITCGILPSSLPIIWTTIVGTFSVIANYLIFEFKSDHLFLSSVGILCADFFSGSHACHSQENIKKHSCVFTLWHSVCV